MNWKPNMKTKAFIMTMFLTMLLSSVVSAQQQALPKFRYDITYREVRKKLMKLGWQPVTLPTATPCGSDDRCRGFPEVYYCQGTGQAACMYMWKKRTTLIQVWGRGEGVQTYSGLTPCPLHPTNPECGGTGPNSALTKSKPKISGSTDCAFCGIWHFAGSGWEIISGDYYLKISQAGIGKFKVAEGYVTDGKIQWDDRIHVRNKWYGISGTGGAIYLKILNGKLQGRVITCNWLYSTEGNETTYKITSELMSNDKMRYTVWSALRGKTDKFMGTRIGN